MSSRHTKIHIFASTGKISLDLSTCKRIGSGNAGDVYSISGGSLPGHCLKIYKNPDKELPNKLRAMIDRPPKDITIEFAGRTFVQFAWPLYLAETDNGKLCGFAMPELDFRQTKSMVTYIEPRESERYLNPEQRSLPQRVAIAANMSSLMANLHQQGHAFIDFKDQNVRIYPENGLVGFVDTDGFRIQAPGGVIFPGRVTTGTFNSPESVKGNKEKLTDEHDRFVLAILIFRLINGGIHPFQGVPRQHLSSHASFTIDQHIERQSYPYGAHGSEQLTPTIGTRHEFWDTKTLAMFERTFSAKNPQDRLSAKEWAQHFNTLIKNKKFERCHIHPNDPDHIHFSGNRCPICTLNGDATATSGGSANKRSGASQTVASIPRQKPSTTSFAAVAPVATPPPPLPPVFANTAAQGTHGYFSRAPTQTLSRPAHGETKGCRGIVIAVILIAIVFFVFSKLNSSHSNAQLIDENASNDAADAAAELTATAVDAAAAADAAASVFSPMAVAAVQVNVRSDPSLDSDNIIAALERGTGVLAAMDMLVNDYARVQLDDGRSGWVGHKMLITTSDAQRLAATDASEYFNRNKDRVATVLEWANSAGSERPQFQPDAPAAVWFTNSAETSKNNGELTAAKDAYLAAICAEPLAPDNYVALGYAAFELGADIVLRDAAIIASRLDENDPDAYVLKGLEAVRKSPSDPSKRQEAISFFSKALAISQKPSITQGFLIKYAALHPQYDLPLIVESAISASAAP